jgi:hypothetical protein
VDKPVQLQSIWDGTLGDEAEEARRGARAYLEVLGEIHRFLQPQRYLEIGIRFGHSLCLATCEAVGVDPAPDLKVKLNPRTIAVTETSDDFFARDNGKFDLIFIDGMHLFENVLRDFIHAEAIANLDGLIVIDDVLPNHPLQANRRRQTQTWTGDVWKIVPVLRTWRPDLKLTLLDTYPTGLLCVSGLNPENRSLPAAYPEILAAYGGDLDPEDEVLNRVGTAIPETEVVRKLATRPIPSGMGKVFRRILGR